MKNNRVIACVVAGALGFALLGGVALAQSSDQSGAQGQQNKGPMGRFMDHLASRLGISTDQLQQAAKDAGKDPAAVRSAVRDAVRQHLQAKVDSGTITASQADKIADQVSHMFGREHRAEKPKPSPSPSPTS